MHSIRKTNKIELKLIEFAQANINISKIDVQANTDRDWSKMLAALPHSAQRSNMQSLHLPSGMTEMVLICAYHGGDGDSDGYIYHQVVMVIFEIK